MSHAGRTGPVTGRNANDHEAFGRAASADPPYERGGTITWQPTMSRRRIRALLPLADVGQFFVLDNRGQLQLMDGISERASTRLPPRTQRIACSADGSRLICADGRGRASVLHVEGGETLAEFRRAGPSSPHLPGSHPLMRAHPQSTSDVALSPDGARAYTASGTLTAKMLERLLREALLEEGKVPILEDPTAELWSGAGLPSRLYNHFEVLSEASKEKVSQRIEDCGPQIAIWDVATGRQIRRKTDTAEELIKVWTHMYPTQALEVIKLRPVAHIGGIKCMALAPSGSLILTGSCDGSVVLWDTDDLVPLQRLHNPDSREPVVAVAFANNERQVTWVHENSNQLCLWTLPGAETFAQWRSESAACLL